MNNKYAIEKQSVDVPTGPSTTLTREKIVLINHNFTICHCEEKIIIHTALVFARARDRTRNSFGNEERELRTHDVIDHPPLFSLPPSSPRPT